MMGQSQDSSDRRITPPVERSFTSPNKQFSLKVFTTDGWKTREPVGELRRGTKLVWSKKLPNSHGPRDAVVLDSGQVVLLDEWINIASMRALTLLGPKGAEKAVFSFQQIRTTMGLTSSDLSQAAFKGPFGRGMWLAGHAVIKGNTLEIPAGGKTIILDLAKPALRKRD